MTIPTVFSRYIERYSDFNNDTIEESHREAIKEDERRNFCADFQKKATAMREADEINTTDTILGLVSRIGNGFLDVMEQYQGERTPAAVGEMAHKVLQVSDKVNHTDGSRLFFWCNWSAIGTYLLKLDAEFGKV